MRDRDLQAGIIAEHMVENDLCIPKTS